MPSGNGERAASVRRGRNIGFLYALATVTAVVIAWAWLTTYRYIPATKFPSPAEVWGVARELAVPPGYANGTIWLHAWHSTQLVLTAFLVSSLTGTAIGLSMGLSRRFEAFINPVIQLVRPVPPLAWIPLAILWLGLDDAAKVFVIWLAAFVPSLINSFTGVRNVPDSYIDAALVHGASYSQLVREVIVPAASPMIFTGLRLSLQASWTTLVAAELVGSFAGLGHILNVAQQDIRPDAVLYAMIWVALCGATMTWLLGLVEKRALRWHT